MAVTVGKSLKIEERRKKGKKKICYKKVMRIELIWKWTHINYYLYNCSVVTVIFRIEF